MRRIVFDLLSDSNSGIDRILSRSSQAVCGAFEKEIIVKDSEVNQVKSKLRKAGYIIVGTGNAGLGRTKIWFNPMGVSL